MDEETDEVARPAAPAAPAPATKTKGPIKAAGMIWNNEQLARSRQKADLHPTAAECRSEWNQLSDEHKNNFL